ncbi:MAG: MaoC family dehydratase N-terminal domain-containing protein [Pseudomonadales bacterium]|nr:MaoC family dehydratase N-terminal domain-containing protein [Pseudomonadales bacterium]
MVDIEELKSRFLNLEFDRKDFVLDPERVAVVARLSGENRPEFTDPTHPDFQASPAFIASLAAGRHLPIEFPRLGGIPMDGGKAVTCLLPVRTGVPLTGRTHLHEIYDKSGRSGRMIFLVSRMEIYDADGHELAINDARMVIREKHDDAG